MSTQQINPTTFEIPALRSLGSGKALAVIALLSAAVFAFLIWLVYFKPSPEYTSPIIASLPTVNATLNSVSTVLLILGYIAVRRRQYLRHMKLMLGAVASSALFFISYVIYHNFHGDTKFLAEGIVRPIYFFTLISHIVLSAVVVPMILTSLFLSVSGRLPMHRKVSRWTLPIWLYVSVTGVLIYLMLKAFNP